MKTENYKNNEFELVFFENGKEKMVLAQGDPLFMQWTKNQLRNAPPYNNGLLILRHKGPFQFEAITDRKHRRVHIPSTPKRRHSIRHQKESRYKKELVAINQFLP